MYIHVCALLRTCTCMHLCVLWYPRSCVLHIIMSVTIYYCKCTCTRVCGSRLYHLGSWGGVGFAQVGLVCVSASLSVIISVHIHVLQGTYTIAENICMFITYSIYAICTNMYMYSIYTYVCTCMHVYRCMCYNV